MRKNGLALVAVAFVALLGGCKTVYDVDDAPSIDGEYEGAFTLAEDTCSPWETDPAWTVLDVRVRNDDETLVNLVLVDYDNYSLLDVGVESDGSYVYYEESESLFYHAETDAVGVLDGETASLDLTLTLFLYDKNSEPQKEERCHTRYTFSGERRYPSHSATE